VPAATKLSSGHTPPALHLSSTSHSPADRLTKHSAAQQLWKGRQQQQQQVPAAAQVAASQRRASCTLPDGSQRTDRCMWQLEPHNMTHSSFVLASCRVLPPAASPAHSALWAERPITSTAALAKVLTLPLQAETASSSSTSDTITGNCHTVGPDVTSGSGSPLARRS
jgi:hypothetical protein